MRVPLYNSFEMGIVMRKRRKLLTILH